MKYLALDYGEKRVGVALSDPEGRTAFPRAAIAMRGKEAFFAELLTLAEAEKVQAFIVGLPLLAGGKDSETTRRARNLAARLKRRSNLPVYLMPEELSSCEAEERLRAAGLRGAKLKARLDQTAAAAILESFLNLPEDGRRLL